MSIVQDLEEHEEETEEYKYIFCAKCKGVGRCFRGGKGKECPDCNGFGFVLERVLKEDKTITTTTKCRDNDVDLGLCDECLTPLELERDMGVEYAVCCKCETRTRLTALDEV